MPRARATFESATSHQLKRPDDRQKLALLTPRERQVLRLIVAEKRTKQIAHELGVSPRTVETYRAHLKTKLQTGSLAALVKFGLLNGLDEE